MRIALAQTNWTAGDLCGKVRCILGYARPAKRGGNKSELVADYGPQCGDMCGGLAVVSDAPKVLDPILRACVERPQPAQQNAESQHVPIALVRDINNKRQQAAPGLKVTTKAFGIGRRFPIAQRFYE